MPPNWRASYVAFDTNICINYMCVRFLDDDGMSAKARDFFNGPIESLDMDPGIPDCIDAALKDGTVRLPWKTVTEFVWQHTGDLYEEGKYGVDDRQKLEKARLFEIIFESQKRKRACDILMGSQKPMI